MSAYLIVRAEIADPADREPFDTWYGEEHLPQAMKAFGALRATRGWSEVESNVHYAFYWFPDLAAAKAVQIAALSNAPAMVRAVKFSAPRARAVPFGRGRLRITWDGRDRPSIDAPIALFFGAGTLHNRNDAEFLVKAFPVNVRFDAERVQRRLAQRGIVTKRFALAFDGEQSHVVIPGSAYTGQVPITLEAIVRAGNRVAVVTLKAFHPGAEDAPIASGTGVYNVRRFKEE